MGSNPNYVVPDRPLGDSSSAAANTRFVLGSTASAAGVSFTPSGGISSTNVQNALVELDTKKAAIASLANIALSGAGVDLTTNAVAWTPALTFAAPGDLAVAYTIRLGRYWQISGNLVLVYFSVITSTFTWSSASGNLQLTGLPFTSQNTAGLTARGSLSFQGINKAGYSQVCSALGTNSSTLTFNASGMGQTSTGVVAADTASGTQVTLTGELLILL